MVPSMTESVAMRVPGMSCVHCTRAVEREIASLAGVEAVHGDLETKLVTVSGSGIDEEALRAAIERAGYEAER